MKDLAKAIKLAAKIREESYNKVAAQKAINSEEFISDFSVFYSISLHHAADTAAEAVGFDKRGTLPVYLLLKLAWNDILDWAQLMEEKE